VARPYGENPVALAVLTNPANSNLFVDPMLTSISRTNDPPFGLDPRPQPGSPALTSPISAPNDGFYTPVSYRGAFANVNWASDWGFAAESCLITGAGAGVPTPPPANLCVATTLSITRNGANVDITFVSVSGAGYRLVASNDITAPLSGWSAVATLTATGSSSTFSVAASGLYRFFVVICQ
jgi:hypothetical protein